MLHLLIGSLVSSSSITSSENRANDTALLQLFLESYFIDVIDNNSNNEATIAAAIILDGDQLQALHTLVRSYLTSLSVPVRFEEKNIDCNMFGSRFLYLDLLPPFKTGKAMKPSDLLVLIYHTCWSIWIGSFLNGTFGFNNSKSNCSCNFQWLMGPNTACIGYQGTWQSWDRFGDSLIYPRTQFL